MAWPMRRVFRIFWWILCALTLCALPLTIWSFSEQGYNIRYQAWFVGGIFVILSFPISVYQVAMHVEYYTQPKLQRHVIRILWMVPVYGVDAWFALRFSDARVFLDPLRECYEAYVIYSFFQYLMAYLEDAVGDVAAHLEKKPPMKHFLGVNWLVRPWRMGEDFLWECKKGVLNYVIIRPLCTALALITDMFGLYGQSQINFSKSYIYLAAATNFSQMWAMYCLIMFYSVLHAELAPIRPLSKFLCIKSVVFLTFWQSVAIAILVWTGVIAKDSWTTYEQLDVATGIQDFLICIEMFVAAVAHAYAFPVRDYMDPLYPRKGFLANVRHMFDLRDVVVDVTNVMEHHVENVGETTTEVLKVPHMAVRTLGEKLYAAGPEGLMHLFQGKKSRLRADSAGHASSSSGAEERLALLSQDEREMSMSESFSSCPAGSARTLSLSEQQGGGGLSPRSQNLSGALLSQASESAFPVEERALLLASLPSASAPSSQKLE